MTVAQDFPFEVGQWVIDIADPSRRGQVTGKTYMAGPHKMVELRFPDGTMKSRPLQALRPATDEGSIDDQLLGGRFGRLRDLQRLLTFEKLKGTLHEVIYSMEAAQIDFYPYQFKPVIKFIDSPAERLVIADEVGLGKTIESMLIWMELVARRQAKRLLIVCPSLLMAKWQAELRTKFTIDARIVGYRDVADVLRDLRERGPGYGCVLITSYTALRPPKAELALLDSELEDEAELSPKTRLIQDLRRWAAEYEPFDLVIFDEAHYMRNTATSSFRLGEALASSAESVLCVSATPVNNKNADLHSLLRLVDPDFFQSPGTFEDLLAANEPAVKAGNALSRIPPDAESLDLAIEGMRASRYISDSPLFAEFESLIAPALDGDLPALARAQAVAEKLNLLGGYVTRTRRVQVKEQRPLREPWALVVEYSAEERMLYDAILHLVRKRCQADSRPFHIFHVLGLQLRAASCLPALAEEIRAGRLGDPEELLDDALGEELLEDEEEFLLAEPPLDSADVRQVLRYDFEANDSKYRQLKHLLVEQLPDDKVIVFSFYHATLGYLARRLREDGVQVAVIHGGLPNDQRLKEIERVKESQERMVLLSSEVGSEGLDLQFCRVVVNYDLPWNPMRVEQRIGRIDRVGQEAKRLIVVNFKVANTVEERLYDRLHAKLLMFANSLGDLEEVIGREVKNLTIQLLSRELSPEEERRLMDQSSRVIEQRLIQMQALEESGDALVALSDYLQRKLEEDRERGRFIQPEELEDFVRDLFEREFQGCEVVFDTPHPGCLTIRLTSEAAQSLTRFIGDDQSLLAQPYRRREFSVSFRREVVMALPSGARRNVAFASHLSPLVRWITRINGERDAVFHPVAAVTLQSDDLPAGAYGYRIERWGFRGLSNREQMAYGLCGLGSSDAVDAALCEAVLQQVLRNGRTWEYPEYDGQQLDQTRRCIDRSLEAAFDLATTRFSNENTTGAQMRVERVNAVFERRLSQDQQRLATLKRHGRQEKMIRLTEGRIRAATEARDARLAELRRRADIDVERQPVAAGVLEILPLGGAR